MATQLFKVVSQKGLRIRTKPDPTNATLVADRTLGYGDILEVRPDSRVVASNFVWWEHEQNPGLWTASQKVEPPEIYMQPYEVPYNPAPVPSTPSTPPTVLFKVVADQLSIRTSAGLGNNLVAGQKRVQGQVIRFKAPSTEKNGFLWWEQADHPGWWTASGSVAGGQTYMLPTEATDPTPDNIAMLTVPWASQVGNVFSNDCGQACALMVLRYNGYGWNKKVDDLVRLPYKNNNGTTNSAHLKNIVRDISGKKLELTPFQLKKADAAGLDEIRNMLKDNRPVILLVWYLSLKFNNSHNGPFNHWVVVTGFKNDNFYLNDPLWLTEKEGAGRIVSSATLLDAAGDTQMRLYGIS